MLPIIQRSADKCGGVTLMAKKIGAPRTAPYAWRTTPAKYVRKLSKLTGFPNHLFRKDLYPKERRVAAQAKKG